MPRTPSTSQKKWIVSPHDAAKAETLRRALRITPVLARVLAARGICEPSSANDFLSCKLRDLCEPAKISGMNEAARALLRAVRDGKRIVIYGDYDVDGITSICVLEKCLRAAGARVSHYLPDRLADGYGLHESAIEEIARAGGQVLVTVDCGIRSLAEVRRARQLGLEVIVTDHHEPARELPQEAIIVNPKIAGPDAPGAELAGVGIAFKLAWAFAQCEAGGARASPTLRNLLVECMGLAALGTVVDVAPLVRENRILVRYGIGQISDSASPGLAAMLEVCRLRDKKLQPYHLGYILGPRLNAAGRMGSADKSLRLLLTDDPSEAREIALELEEANRQRRQIEAQILQEVQERIVALDGRQMPVVVEAGDDWHEGIVGIVASKIAEMFNRPTILFGWNGQVWRGSGRSVPGVHLLELIEACADLLASYGGHAQAAGVKVAEAQLEPFRKRINEIASSRIKASNLEPQLRIDAEVALGELDEAAVRDIMRMEPFGEGNPEPVLAARGVRLAGAINRMGQGGQHASFLINQETATLRAVAFRQGDLVEEAAQNAEGRFDIAFIPRLNEYKGRATPEAELLDIRPAEGQLGRPRSK